jgi:hypothetical protein
VIGVEKAVETAAIPNPGNDGKIIQAYYDAARKCYWVPNSRGNWIEVSEQGLRKMLRADGLRNKAQDGENLSQVDDKFVEIMTTQDVAYAGPLAGHRAGITECCGSRILVTSSPKLIQPARGRWPVLRAFLEALLDDGTYDQRPYVYGWLKIAYEALRSGVWRPGQALGLAGPRNCGKSLLQLIITEILGGRAAKPFRYMSGRTDFNADLFAAEHLTIEDDHSSTDIRARRQFAAQIKQFTVNKIQSCHGKNRQALSLTPFWRLSISVNDEPEAMMVLPPVSDSEHDSLSDKLFLLRALKAEMPMPTEGNDQQAAFWQALVSELPAFIYYLQRFEIPDELRDGRFGIKTWHHPRLLADLDALAPETRLLALVDQAVFTALDLGGGPTGVPPEFWSGTAEELERRLVSSHFDYEARRLLSWPGACGTFLGRLADKPRPRVQKDRDGHRRGWIIYRTVEAAEAALNKAA